MRVFEAKIVYRLVNEGSPVRLESPEAIAAYMASAYHENPVQEQFYVIFLSRKHHPIGRMLVSLGSLTSTVVSPRDVFRGAILANSASIVVSHNHPSGDPFPSAADLTITRMLREAARIVEIALLDHVIVGDAAADPLGKGYYSFREAGVL